MTTGPTTKAIDLTGFAARYKEDTNAVEKLCREQGVSKPTVYKAMRRAGIKVRMLGANGASTRIVQRHVFTAEDDIYIRKNFPSKKSLALVAIDMPSGPCHHSVLKAQARKLGVRRSTVRSDAHYSAPGPKIRTSEAPPEPVKFANVIHWLRKVDIVANRAIKPGLWNVNGIEDLTVRQVVLLANDMRTRWKPEALPLFDCNFDGLRGA